MTKVALGLLGQVIHRFVYSLHEHDVMNLKESSSYLKSLNIIIFWKEKENTQQLQT